jgi:exodeoxyribonuclease III
MRLATFNINDVNKRLGVLLAWLDAAEPDIVCLQELKAVDAGFPAEELKSAGYSAVWAGQASWNGVAILSRGSEPVLTRKGLPGDPSDKQARYIEAAVDGLIVACLYAPNGNPQPGPKYDYKLDWHERLNQHAKQLLASDLPVVLAGDFNIVPEGRDIYVTTSYADNALVQPQSRAAYAALIKQGWVDAVRKLYPDETIYTFWDYRRKRWERDAGLRIDHLLVSRKLVRKVRAARVDREVRALPDASDHAPVWIEIT